MQSRAWGDTPAGMALTGMFDLVRRFRGPVDPVDDLSLIIVRRRAEGTMGNGLP